LPSVVVALFQWTNDGSDWYCTGIWPSRYYFLCYGYYCFYIHFCDMSWHLVSWFGDHIDMWTWLYCYIMYTCPYSDLEILDLYSSVLPSLWRLEVIIPTILCLASVGLIIHCLHPSITYLFGCYLDLLLD
jgi:hypothetical protein